MRKTAFCICENKDADQLRDQRLCFRYFLNFNPLAIFGSCTAWSVSDQVGNQNVDFSHEAAQMSFMFM